MVCRPACQLGGGGGVGQKVTFDGFPLQIAATGSLYSCVVTHGSHRLSAAAGRIVSRMVLVVKAKPFLGELVAGDPTWASLLLASAVCRCCAKGGGALGEYAEQLVAMFLSVAIASKTKPPITAVVGHVTTLLSIDWMLSSVDVLFLLS